MGLFLGIIGFATMTGLVAGGLRTPAIVVLVLSIPLFCIGIIARGKSEKRAWNAAICQVRQYVEGLDDQWQHSKGVRWTLVDREFVERHDQSSIHYKMIDIAIASVLSEQELANRERPAVIVVPAVAMKNEEDEPFVPKQYSEGPGDSHVYN